MYVSLWGLSRWNTSKLWVSWNTIQNFTMSILQCNLALPLFIGHAAMQTCDVVICYSHSAMQSTTCVLVCSCSLISYCRPAPGPCYSSFAFLLNAYLLMGQEVEMSHVATISHIYILNVHYYVLSRDVPDLITWSEFGDVHAIFKGLESGGKDPDRWFVLKVV